MQHEYIEPIQDWHRKRRATMDMRKRTDLALGANLRLWLGWRRDLPTEESDRIKLLAADLVDCGEKLAKGKKHELAESPEYLDFGPFIRMTIDARRPTDEFEALATKKLGQLAMGLPVWSAFGENIKGFGPVSLASIIGETGDLSAYETHSKLWRRMGMAPFAKDGITRSGQQWKMKGGLDAEDWTAFGYNGRRRSIMFVIEDVLIKNTGQYYRVYIDRKEALCRRALIEGKLVVPAAKIPKGRADEFISLGQISAQAKQYMGKRLLRDLWQAWRRAVSGAPEMATRVLPAAENGEAVLRVRESAKDNLPLPQQANQGMPKAASPCLPDDTGEATADMRNSAIGSPPLSQHATRTLPETAVEIVRAAKNGEAVNRLHASARVEMPLRRRASAALPGMAKGPAPAAKKTKAGKAARGMRASARGDPPSRPRGQTVPASNGRGEPAR